MQIFGIDIKTYFLLFIIYAVIGWCMEVTCKWIQYKRFINRGFLIGPYCPIYGCGAILITIFLNKYINDPLALFIMAIIICGMLEYLTSYLMEKIFKARWWDYSQKKFNINGRVCLNTIIPFGILGLFIMYISNPFLLEKISQIPYKYVNILFYTILSTYILDNIISLTIVGYLRKTERTVSKELDNTEEITNKVREILQNKSILHRRLINAYPTLQTIKIKIKEKKDEIKKQVKEEKIEIENKVIEKTKKIEDKINTIIEENNNNKKI